MSGTPYLGQTVDTILGQDFLTWLWFRSDTAPGSFADAKGTPFSVSMEQRIVVRGGEGESTETASVSGALSTLREAKLGLLTGKKVVQALVRIEKDDMAWQAVIKAESFSCNSLRTPRVERDADDDDPDAVFLEKAYLVSLYFDCLDSLYLKFIRARLNPSTWREEVAAVKQWINDSADAMSGAAR